MIHAIPASLDAATSERRELVLTLHEIDAQLSDDERSRDRQWRASAVRKRGRVLARMGFLKDWIKQENIAVMTRQRSIVSEDPNADPTAVLIAQLRNALFDAYVGSTIPPGVQRTLDAATHRIREMSKETASQETSR